MNYMSLVIVCMPGCRELLNTVYLNVVVDGRVVKLCLRPQRAIRKPHDIAVGRVTVTAAEVSG